LIKEVIKERASKSSS